MHPSLRRRWRVPQPSPTPTNSISLFHHSGMLEEIMEEVRDWSNLNIDLLEMILDRLLLVDHLEFGKVCRSWRSGLLAYRARASFLVPKFPLLMNPTFSFGSSRRFLDPSALRHSTSSLGDLCANTCIGSSGSWLIMRSASFLVFVNGYRVYLYNPFTVTRIMLPKLEILYKLSDEVVACLKPGTPDMAVVYFGISRGRSYVYCLRCGDRKWSKYRFPAYLNNSIIRIIQIVPFCDQEFYFLTRDGWLGHIKLDRDPPVVLKDEIGRVQFDLARENAYLVECSPGKLLVAIMNYQTLPCLRVFRLDFNVTSEWINVKLGDVTKDRLLFLGHKGSLSIPIASCGNGISTRVYIVGQKSGGMLNMKTGELIVSCGNSGTLSGIWILPQPPSRDGQLRWWLRLFYIVEGFFLPAYVLWLVLLQVVYKTLLMPPPIRDTAIFLLLLPAFVMVTYVLLLLMILIAELRCTGCNRRSLSALQHKLQF